MNIVDWVILGFLGVCVLFGLYRGFIQSVLNLGGLLLSFAGSFWLFPRVADAVSANGEIMRTISSYTNSTFILGNLDLSSQAVSTLSAQTVAEIIQNAKLPAPINTILAHNLNQRVFEPLGDLAVNVGDYINQTILSISVNVLSFLVCFVACFLVSTIIINMVRAVFRYPVMKHLDGLVGGVFGFLLGLTLCFIVFTVAPILQSVVPISQFQELLDSSALGKIFMNGNLMISIMNRRL